MKFGRLASVLLPILVAVIFNSWYKTPPRQPWFYSDQEKFETCPQGKEPLLVFGATSMLGRYIVEKFNEDESICFISLSRSTCSKCDIQIKGNIKDGYLIRRVIEFYKPQTLITSVKPPLLGIKYKTYIEVNLLSMIQLIDIYKQVSKSQITSKPGIDYVRFIYISSIAAAGHYFPHEMASENEIKPYYTDYEAPYDVSKRLAEDHLLAQHSDDFQVISLRIGGVVGGEGDAYDYLRWPILFTIDPPPKAVDSNYAGNIADAIYVMYKAGTRGFGKFYYYTGEAMEEREKVEIVQKLTGKLVLTSKRWMVDILVDNWYKLKWDPDIYSHVDLFRMGLIPQSFNQSLFRKTFPEFKEKFTLAEAIEKIYS